MVKKGVVVNWRQAGSRGALFLILLTMIFNGCAGAERPRTEKQVVTEYLLQQAGFQKWGVNDETPKRKALLDVLSPGTIMTYKRDGQIYHAYGDQNSGTLYVGDEAAYQKYLTMAKGEQLCGRAEGTNTEKFWSCFDEYQKTGGSQPGK